MIKFSEALRKKLIEIVDDKWCPNFSCDKINSTEIADAIIEFLSKMEES